MALQIDYKLFISNINLLSNAKCMPNNWIDLSHFTSGVIISMHKCIYSTTRAISLISKWYLRRYLLSYMEALWHSLFSEPAICPLVTDLVYQLLIFFGEFYSGSTFEWFDIKLIAFHYFIISSYCFFLIAL